MDVPVFIHFCVKIHKSCREKKSVVCLYLFQLMRSKFVNGSLIEKIEAKRVGVM